jgi:hypothetical protein
VKFRPQDVKALLALLSRFVFFLCLLAAHLTYSVCRDSRVGAVCGRTFPLGTGPLYWYQIFDYAIGHWFQKTAEHVLG